jgi:peptide/nickel transport system permease protein
VFVYILKRLGMSVIVLLIVMVFLSLLVQLVPGDAATALLGPRATEELVAKVRSQMELDQPVYIQVAHFVWNTLHGDFGNDFWSGRPISQYIGDVLPHTIALALSSLGLAIFLGIPLGVFSATHPNSWLDRFLAVVSISFITLPSYVSALFLLYIFAVNLKVLPAMGVGEPGDTLDYLRHLVLPSIAMAIPWIGYLARLVRTSILEILNTNYIRVVRSFGLHDRVIFYKYALKNAIIPTVAVLGLGLGGLMGGAMFIEIIFARPGMGSFIYNAIGARNYPMVRAGVLVIGFIFVAANLLADITYSWLDPRIQLGESKG